MKIKPVSFILSQLKTLLAIVLVASVTILIVRKYSYQDKVKITSNFATESNKKINEDINRLKRTQISSDNDYRRNDHKNMLFQSKKSDSGFKKPEVLLSDNKRSKESFSKLTKSIEFDSGLKKSQISDYVLKKSKKSDSVLKKSKALHHEFKKSSSMDSKLKKYNEMGAWFKKFRQSHLGEKCVKRLPQAIIVGIQKSGTTALNHFLNDHPQIKACIHPAETQYFSMHYNRPLSWYRNLMPCSYANQITIEKSPPYFYRRFCAERIRRMNPKTKIIIIVKDPITRAQSMYAMLKEHSHGRIKSFEELITLKSRKIINGHSIIIDFSNYPKYIGAWLDNFKLNQILFVDGHNLEENPAQELNKVEKFLGVHTFFTADKFIFNKSKGKYCSKSNSSGNGMQCLSDKKGRPHQAINKAMRHKLEAYFGPKNKKFFSMIKQRFDWGY